MPTMSNTITYLTNRILNLLYFQVIILHRSYKCKGFLTFVSNCFYLLFALYLFLASAWLYDFPMVVSTFTSTFKKKNVLNTKAFNISHSLVAKMFLTLLN